MNFKLIMLSLLSLSIYSSVYSMDSSSANHDKSKKDEFLKKHNTQLALLAGTCATLATYKLMPVELLWQVSASLAIGINGKGSQLFIEDYFWVLRFLNGSTLASYQPYSYKEMQTITTLFKIAKFLTSSFVGYKAYKLVKSK